MDAIMTIKWYCAVAAVIVVIAALFGLIRYVKAVIDSRNPVANHNYVDVTEEMITEGQANRMNTRKCVGALALNELAKSFLDVKYISWGNTSGNIGFTDGDELQFDALDKNGNEVEMMDLVTPQRIYFRLS